MSARTAATSSTATPTTSPTSGISPKRHARRCARRRSTRSARTSASCSRRRRRRAKHTVTVFTDVDCPFCRRFHEQIAQVQRERHRGRLPVLPAADPSGADKQAEAVWCSKDRPDAFTAAMAGKDPGKATCPNPVSGIDQLAQSLGIGGTPTVLADDGTPDLIADRDVAGSARSRARSSGRSERCPQLTIARRRSNRRHDDPNAPPALPCIADDTALPPAARTRRRRGVRKAPSRRAPRARRSATRAAGKIDTVEQAPLPGYRQVDRRRPDRVRQRRRQVYAAGHALRHAEQARPQRQRASPSITSAKVDAVPASKRIVFAPREAEVQGHRIHRSRLRLLPQAAFADRRLQQARHRGRLPVLPAYRHRFAVLRQGGLGLVREGSQGGVHRGQGRQGSGRR